MKKFSIYILYVMTIALLLGISSCGGTDNEPTPPLGNEPQGGGAVAPGGMSGTTADDGDTPTFDYTISAWNGETADDASQDKAGTDSGLYYEANTFSKTVTITYDGATASVENSNSQITCHVSGAYVTVDMLTNSVSGVNIVLKGKSEDGGLKIYGEKKFKLTLQGVELTSKTGPAINNQCKKAMFVHLADGTVNKLTDATTYGNDAYYYSASTAEDRKGCFFSEGNMLLSGTGTLVVAGKNNHALVTDGLLLVRHGVTLVVSESANNAIHVKGDSDKSIGVKIEGGLIHASVASVAGKAIKCDMDVEIVGGKLVLNTTGSAEYDTTEKDTSSSAGIKSDANFVMSGGTVTMKSTGSGGKGVNVVGDITIKGGDLTVVTAGGEFAYSSSITSSPKAVKADGNITISDGTVKIAAMGKSDGSEGLECEKTLTVSGGDTYVYAYDDAVNVTTAINVTGGSLYAYSVNNDGIDANGTLTVSGGTLIGVGTNAPEGGIDVDSSNKFVIKGGTVISYGGTLQSTPSTSSTQCSVACSGIQASKGNKINVLNSSSSTVVSFDCPRSMNSASFFFSAAGITKGSSYTINVGGSDWTTFTASNIVNTVK